MVVLGIDPSLNATGWAALEYKNNAFKLLCCGVINPPKSIKVKFMGFVCDNIVGDNYVAKIGNISSQIEDIIRNNSIHSVGIEETVVNVNPRSSLKLGMVRGAIIATCFRYGLSVKEYNPKHIKASVTGVGSAEKSQVAYMVSKMVEDWERTKLFKGYDATDAAAVGITNALYCSSLISR